MTVWVGIANYRVETVVTQSATGSRFTETISGDKGGGSYRIITRSFPSRYPVDVKVTLTNGRETAIGISKLAPAP